MTKLLILVVVLLAAGLGVALSMANPEPVTVDLLFGQWTAPLIWILAAEFFVVIVGCVVFMQVRAALFRRRIRRLEKQQKALEDELNTLRTLPLSEV